MRAATFGVILVFAASAAGARPFALPAQNDGATARLTLPSENSLAASVRQKQSDPAMFDATADRTAPQAQGLSFGPIRAERASDLRPGRSRQVLRYRVEGMNVLGGSIGGSLDGRGGMLLLQWQH